MPKPARRLGRGLNSLVSSTRVSSLPESLPETPVEGPGVVDGQDPMPSDSIQAQTVPTCDLHPNPLQPRTDFNPVEISSLADSIRLNGMVQPIAVRIENGRMEIIAGERRWRAAQILGLERVPVIVRRASDRQMLELALIENIQREDLNAIERALAYRSYCTRFGAKPAELAERMGEDRTTLLNYLRLLELPESVQAAVAVGKLSMGHARCLLGLPDTAARMQLAESAVAKQLSVRALEEIVRRRKRDPAANLPDPTPMADKSGAHLRDLQRRFEEAIKTKVTIREGPRKGAGRIVIDYFSLDDFDRIAKQMGVELE